jgi:hypothetical protein
MRANGAAVKMDTPKNEVTMQTPIRVTVRDSDHSHADPYVALRDAFEGAKRQLRDLASA